MNERHTSEASVAKLRQEDVPMSQRQAVADAPCLSGVSEETDNRWLQEVGT